MKENMPAEDTTLLRNFIPISRFALMEHINNLEKCSEEEKADNARFFQSLIAWRHKKYRQRLSWLKRCYLPFSPDRDTLRVLKYTDDERAQLQQTVVRLVANHIRRIDIKRNENAWWLCRKCHELSISHQTIIR